MPLTSHALLRDLSKFLLQGLNERLDHPSDRPMDLFLQLLRPSSGNDIKGPRNRISSWDNERRDVIYVRKTPVKDEYVVLRIDQTAEGSSAMVFHAPDQSVEALKALVQQWFPGVSVEFYPAVLSSSSSPQMDRENAMIHVMVFIGASSTRQIKIPRGLSFRRARSLIEVYLHAARTPDRAVLSSFGPYEGLSYEFVDVPPDGNCFFAAVLAGLYAQPGSAPALERIRPRWHRWKRNEDFTGNFREELVRLLEEDRSEEVSRYMERLVRATASGMSSQKKNGRYYSETRRKLLDKLLSDLKTPGTWIETETFGLVTLALRCHVVVHHGEMKSISHHLPDGTYYMLYNGYSKNDEQQKWKGDTELILKGLWRNAVDVPVVHVLYQSSHYSCLLPRPTSPEAAVLTREDRQKLQAIFPKVYSFRNRKNGSPANDNVIVLSNSSSEEKPPKKKFRQTLQNGSVSKASSVSPKKKKLIIYDY